MLIEARNDTMTMKEESGDEGIDSIIEATLQRHRETRGDNRNQQQSTAASEIMIKRGLLKERKWGMWELREDDSDNDHDDNDDNNKENHTRIGPTL